MLLRRVISHVRKQEWTAIGIDFLIVVIGVFIGLQVNTWNTNRQDRERGEIYSERLKSELRFEHEYARAQLAYNRSTLRAGQLAFSGLSGKADVADEVVLINAYRATQHNWFERRRAAFDEIVASGSMALVSDPALLETAMGIYNTPIFDMMLREGQSAKYRELFRMTIEADLHDLLGRSCGDREYEVDGGVQGLLTLDYECDLDASAEEIEAAVASLRADPEILRTLRLRNAQNAGWISDLELTTETLGLDALFQEVSVP
jgi:hypothetical protein